ncbi:MAG TPA: LmeA family phospholipid-binding protein [Acidimicrobiales bacterium]|nr:LmeA family phospholipid-binding protein [Acidimicrobiales bacterium]
MVGVVADVAAKQYVKAEIEEAAEARSGSEARAEASLHAFPFIPQILLSGRAGGVEVDVTDFRAGPLHLSALEVDLGDVHVDERALLRSREVLVTRIRDATVAVELTADDLAEATNLPLTIDAGRLGLTVAGRRVPVTPTLGAGGALRLGGVSVPARVLRLEAAGVVACTDTSVEIIDDRLRLTCTTEEVPPVVLQAAQRRLGLALGVPAESAPVVRGVPDEGWWGE